MLFFQTSNTIFLLFNVEGQLPLIRMFPSTNSSGFPPVGGYPGYSVETTTLDNKIIVAAVNNCSALARVSITFRAGTRYESYGTRGVTQYLKVSAGCTTKGYSRFAIMRNLQELCTPLTCSVGRETISYTLEGEKCNVERALVYLADVALNTCFKHWEVNENIPRLDIELENRTPQQFVIDLIHQAAYRSSGLGNSIYIAKHRLNNVSIEQLQDYVSNYFVAKNCAVVGAGISIKKLIEFARCIDVPKGRCENYTPSKIVAGEIRSEKGGCLSHVAIAAEGGCLRDARELLSFAILQRVVGSGTYIKHTNENSSLLSNTYYPDSVRAFNFNYSDSGLFGVLITASYTKIPCIIESVYNILKQAKISTGDFERGKVQAKASFLMTAESACNYLENIANQALATECVPNPCEIFEAFEHITQNDLKEAADKVTRGKFSIASVGQLSTVPYLSDL
ncbi:hypothetical protein RI129_002324 [Pyrocoelia pectoralis]|uniref:Uncharacterized protein n=1 Tax=Pyrocoelia pectoralis TaxID=417401 RepID=A0AAN7ZKZ8_9COLE